MIPDERKRQFQFSIRGMLVMTAAVAVGCSVGCLKTAKLEDGLFAFAATWIVVGLAVQISDLWAAFRQTSGLTLDQRGGWWFAILARAALAMLLIGHFLLMELLATGRITLVDTKESGYLGPAGHEVLRGAVFALSLFVVLAGFGGGKTPRRRRRWTIAVNFLTMLAVVVFAYHFLLDRFLISGLVHIACEGIVRGMPHGHRAYAEAFTDAQAMSLFTRSLLAGGMLLLDLFFLRVLILCWNDGKLRRALAVAALTISLAITAINPVWLATRGLKELSPFFAETIAFAPANRWAFGALLAFLFITAAARRIIPTTQKTSNDFDGNWRRRPSAYSHEYRLLALLIAGTVICMEVREMMPIMSLRPIWPSGQSLLMYHIQEVIELTSTGSHIQLWLLVLCLAIYRAIFGFARGCQSLGSPPRELPLPLYTIVWTALLATVVMAVPIFAALGFGLALNWWRLPF